MVSRPMVSVGMAFEVWWFLLWTACCWSSVVPPKMVDASETLEDPFSTKDERVSGQRQRQRPFLVGVMVDAGRHEFSVDWIKSFMCGVHKMGFNTLHLTLANDQRFAFTTTTTEANHTQSGANVRSGGATPSKNPRFTTHDLRNLAEHARSLGNNMTLLPEVSLPFFAASWTGSCVEGEDRLLAPLPCPRYLCSTVRSLPISGINLPLDIRHPRIRDIVRTVLRSLVEGLEKPAYLHLGSATSSGYYGCWEEVLEGSSEKGSRPDYEGFENTLAEIVADDLGYRPRIVRSSVGDDDHRKAAATLGTNAILQYQNHKDVAISTQQQTGSSDSYLLQPKELNLATTLLKDHPTGWAIYKETLEILLHHRANYEEGSFEGIIISTEALPPSWFEERNVMGRLLAVSMAVQSFEASFQINREEDNPSDGASKQTKSTLFIDRAEFERSYRLLCDGWFPSDSANSFCDRLGGLNTDPSSSSTVGIISNRNLDDPKTRMILHEQIVAESKYKKKYSKMWEDWASDICHRLTHTEDVLHLQTPAANTVQMINDEAVSSYWLDLNEETSSNHEGHARKSIAGNESLQELRIGRSKIPFRGFILDLVDDLVPPEALQDLMEQIMVPLGLNTLQLSLINHLGCSLQLESLEGLYHLVPTPPKAVKPISDEVLREVVAVGDRLGIELIPEISVTTQATGWYHAGFLVDCPSTLCSTADARGNIVGGAISNDVNNGSLLPVVLSVIQKLRSIFRSGSFLHLGSDERAKSEACWTESGKSPDYNRFERILSSLLEAKKWYNASNILRWENKEGIVYPERTGKITQYRYGKNTSPHEYRNVSLSAVGGRRVNHEESEALVFGSLSITPFTHPWTIYHDTRNWVADNGVPTKGLLARVRLNEFDSDPNHYKAGILAFAIGLSSEAPDLNNEASLNDFISVICAGKNSKLCPSPTYEKVGRKRSFTRSRGQMLCKAMTSTISHPVMRLGDEKGSTVD